MFSTDIIIILLSIFTIVIVPIIKVLFDGIETSVFNKTKQVTLDYYSSLDSQIDHLLEMYRVSKNSIEHLREVFELKILNLETRLENLEKK